MHKEKLMKLVTCLACALAAAAPAAAQDTRAGQAEQQRAEKAKELKPYLPGKVERAMFLTENGLMASLFAPPRGLFARFGGLPEGSGFGAGPGYRYLAPSWSFATTSAISIRGSREIEARFSYPPPNPVPYRASISVGGHYRNLPQEAF